MNINTNKFAKFLVDNLSSEECEELIQLIKNHLENENWSRCYDVSPPSDTELLAWFKGGDSPYVKKAYYDKEKESWYAFDIIMNCFLPIYPPTYWKHLNE